MSLGEFTDAAILAVLHDLGPSSAITVTHELIDRGQSANRFAIGAVDNVRRVLRRLVRDGEVRIAERRECRMPSKQVIYVLASSQERAL